MATTTTTAAELKPLAALSLLLVLVLVLVGGGADAQEATCAGQLSGLAPCARYSVPPPPGQAPPRAGAGVLLRAGGRVQGLRLRDVRHHQQPAGQVRPPASHLP